MSFQPVKCNMMQLTRKRLNKIQASYTLEGAVLENVDNIKYLKYVCSYYLSGHWLQEFLKNPLFSLFPIEKLK